MRSMSFRGAAPVAESEERVIVSSTYHAVQQSTCHGVPPARAAPPSGRKKIRRGR